jgi:hypothetical protein
MGNMSYCRFRNTLKDLEDCFEDWDNEDISEEEKEAREELLKKCKEIVDKYREED